MLKRIFDIFRVAPQSFRFMHFLRKTTKSVPAVYFPECKHLSRDEMDITPIPVKKKPRKQGENQRNWSTSNNYTPLQQNWMTRNVRNERQRYDPWVGLPRFLSQVVFLLLSILFPFVEIIEGKHTIKEPLLSRIQFPATFTTFLLLLCNLCDNK